MLYPSQLSAGLAYGINASTPYIESADAFDYLIKVSFTI